MADEFFRPFFNSGVWAQGEPVPGPLVQRDAGNTNSIPRRQVEPAGPDVHHRRLRCGGCRRRRSSARRAPTAIGNDTSKVATRFGFSTTWSPEQRFTNSERRGPDNTTLRLADSLNVFDTGSLAPGVTVDRVDYRILSFDAGLKYKGIFLQTEIYNRWLDNFKADGAAAGRQHPRHGLLRAGGVLPGAEEARALRRDVTDLRRQVRRASTTAPSTWWA